MELDKTNTLLAELLRGLELRKRSYFVNMPSMVYIIGTQMKEYRVDMRFEYDRRISI